MIGAAITWEAKKQKYWVSTSIILLIALFWKSFSTYGLGKIGDFEIGAKWQWKLSNYMFTFWFSIFIFVLLLLLVVGFIHQWMWFHQISKLQSELHAELEEVKRLKDEIESTTNQPNEVSNPPISRRFKRANLAGRGKKLNKKLQKSFKSQKRQPTAHNTNHLKGSYSAGDLKLSIPDTSSHLRFFQLLFCYECWCVYCLSQKDSVNVSFLLRSKSSSFLLLLYFEMSQH